MTLQEFIDMEYSGDTEACMQELMFESVVPAICTNPGCDYTDDLEPDARNVTCPECGTKTVQSVVELLITSI